MSTKALITVGMIIGSVIGGYIPTFFGAGIISYSSVFFSGIGAIAGMWVGYKLSNF